MKPLQYIIPFLLLSTSVVAGNFTITANDSVTLAPLTGVSVFMDNYYFLQETANTSTGQGGSANGSYSYTQTNGTNGYLYINYTQNTSVYSYNTSISQVKIGLNMSSPSSGINGQINYTLPAACNLPNTQLRIYTKSSTTTGQTYGQCYDGTSWNTYTENNVCTGSSASLFGSSGNDYSYDTNYSRGTYFKLSGINLFTNTNSTSYSFFPSTCDGTGGFGANAAGIIWEEAIWWKTYNEFTVNTNNVTNIPNNGALISNITLTKSGYVPLSFTAWNTSSNLTANMTPNYLNISFYDENNTSIILGTTIVFSITGSGFSYNNTTSTGSALVAGVPANSTLAIIYSAPGYNQRAFYANLSSGNNSLILFLRTTSSSTPLLIQVQDQALSRVSQALVYQTVKNLSGTNYYTTEICQTDSNGQCIMSADISTSTYRATTTYNFVVYYNGTQVGQSGDTVVATTASSACNSALPCLQLVVTIGNSALNTFFKIPDIEYSITNSSSNDFNFSLTDNNNIVSQICLTSYMHTGATSTQTNRSCVSSSNGTLTVFSNSSLGDYTEFVGTAVIAGQTYYIDTQTVPNQSSGGDGSLLFIVFGGVGILLTVILAYKGQGSLALIMGVVAVDILFLISSLPGLAKGFVVAVTLILLLVVSRLKE